MARGAVVRSDYNIKRSHMHYTLWRWTGSRFINILLSAVIFFLAALLVQMTFFPRVYESDAAIYVTAVSGTRVSASALGDALAEKANAEITDGLTGFESVPVSQRIRIKVDLGESIVRIKTASTDPYSAYDAVRRAIDLSYGYLEENDARDAIRIVSYPEFAKHFSYLSVLMPAFYAALAGAVLALLWAVISHRKYEAECIEEKKLKEQEAASAYAAFAPENVKAASNSRVNNSQEELMKSLEERTGLPDAQSAGENMRKIMSAIDPDDDSGKITIPAYRDEEGDILDDDDAVNFLHFSQEETGVSIEDEFDEDAMEEDLVKLFADDPTSVSAEKKGG